MEPVFSLSHLLPHPRFEVGDKVRLLDPSIDLPFSSTIWEVRHCERSEELGGFAYKLRSGRSVSPLIAEVYLTPADEVKLKAVAVRSGLA